MPSLREILFWLLTATIVYTYAIYPIAVAVAARLKPSPIRRARFNEPISIVIAAYNEEAHIEAQDR